MGLFKQMYLAVKSLIIRSQEVEEESDVFSQDEVEKAYQSVHKQYNTPEDQEYLDNTRKNSKEK